VPDNATYFERPIPVALVLGAFVLGVVPLAVLQLVPNDLGFVPHLALLSAVGLGTTHFFLTLAIYFSGAHLRYFVSSGSRILIYFGLPVLIFALLAWIGGSDVRVRYPAEVGFFFAVVRLFDFVHVGRQSFGVLQLWKRPLHAELPSWSRSAENMFFVGAALMQWQTFWSGGNFATDQLETWLPAATLAALFVAVSGSYLRPALRDRPGARLALAYFLVQAICSAAAVYRTWLYLTALAVHYLEYHVIMYPRCFAPDPEARRRSDWLRGRAPLFYALLAPLVILFELRNSFQPGSIALGYLIHIFDGIFLAHYVLDAFLWRFGNPFYRDTLGPLYFAPVAPAAPRPRRAVWALAAVGLVALLAFAAWSRGASRLTDPIHAQNHLRWGVELAQRGERAAAERHLNEALRRAPHDANARNALDWLKTRSK
jgi:hypothetical protein